MIDEEKYCESLFRYVRRPTCPVRVGNLTIGGDAPIAVQSMCTTDTMNSEASVVQACEIIGAGGELVRYTAQTVQHAANLKNIRKALADAGFSVPLVADVHFNPRVAFEAAKHVQKVRINPGNFVDRRAGSKQGDTAGLSCAEELERLRERFLELLTICRRYRTALRIGVNHGSLSDRIMTRYGDTPVGMVASAMEFLRLCREEHFEDVVVSMKSSNTQVMVHAYRLLCAAMRREDMAYPLHLGVTEAGEGEDGRVKSAVGIGALLNDGIGDTLRVSLTEHPAREIPVARMLAGYYENREMCEPVPECPVGTYRPYEYAKRSTRAINGMGGGNSPRVVGNRECADGAVSGSDMTPSFLAVYGVEMTLSDLENVSPDSLQNKIVVLNSTGRNAPAEIRSFFLHLNEKNIDNPVVIKRTYDVSSVDELIVRASADLGMAFIDGMGDGLWIDTKNARISGERVTALAFAILQAARVRITKTEYISCPGCGRTLYSLEETLREIKRRTSGLTGLKIAVMGCIVNGPGEMADADYGYVGSGPGRVNLYKGRELVKRNVPQHEAVNELVDLIRTNGDWNE